MTVGVFAIVALVSAADGGLSISGVLGLSRAEAAGGLPVTVEGVVTYADPRGRDFFLEADGAAISMWYPDAGVELHQGDRLRLRARTHPGDYAPRLEPLAVERLSSDALVPASAPTQAELASGSIDCRSVTLDAIVRSAHTRDGRTELRLADLFGPTRLLFPVGVAVPEAASWVGAEVRVRATVAVDLNERRQRTGLRLYAQSAREIEVRQPARATGDLAQSQLGELLQYHPVPGDPRVRVHGVVSYVSGQSTIITDGADTTRVRFVREADISPALVGQELELVGFVDVLRDRPLISDAVLLSTRPGSLSSRRVTPGGLLEGALDDQLVEVEGVVVQHVTSPVALLSLEGDGVPFLAMTLSSTPSPLAKALEPGTRVALTGIKATTTDHAAPVVLLRSSDDVRVVAAAPFWTLPRALSAAAVFLGLLLLALLRIRSLGVASAALEAKVTERTERLAERTRELELQREELLTLHGLRARSIAVIAHDVRSPLSAIQLNADLLAGPRDAESRREVVEDITRAVQQVSHDMTELVRRYRDERVLLRREQLDLGAATRRALERASSFLVPKRQRVELEGASSRVLGDDGVVEHVLVNLLSNASKYSPPETVITVRFGAPGVVSVVDRGVGLEADDLACLFDPTRRPKNRPTGNEPTSGEGLLLVHRWVVAMGGTITCISSPGAGSTFTVRLPAA